MVFRTESVPAGKRSVEGEHPAKDVYLKVLPMGTFDVPGVLVGFPTLHQEPYGLGYLRRKHTHHFSAVGVHLPRARIVRRMNKERGRPLVRRVVRWLPQLNA